MKRHKTTNNYSWLALLLAMALVASACTSSGTDETSTTAGGETATTEGETATTEGETTPTTEPAPTEVVMSIALDEGTLTPFTHVSAPLFLRLVWDALLMNDSNNVLQPLVASELTVNDDRTEFTFTIREGQVWHDGEPLTVDDVVFSYLYTAEKGFTTSLFDIVESVEAVDDNTVVFSLTETAADIEQDLFATVSIIPEHIFKDVDDPKTDGGIELAVGSGPYSIADYVPGQSYTLVANEAYIPGTPTIDTLTMPIIEQASTAYAALLAGETDISSVALTTELIPEFDGTDGVELLNGSSFPPELIIINAERPPFDRTEVRQAISLAIDVEELMAIVALGDAVAPNAGFLHPESPLSTQAIDHVFDAAQAAKLLDDLGAALGDDGVRVLDGDPLSFSLLVDAAAPNSVRNAELVSEMLAKVGIDARPEPIEVTTLWELTWPGFDVNNGRDFDMAFFTWSAVLTLRGGRYTGLIHSDPSRGTLNLGGLSDPDADAAVEAFDVAVTAETRLAALQAVAEQIAELVPFVTLYYPNTTYAYRPDAYDGWTYRGGFGPVNTTSFVDFEDF